MARPNRKVAIAEDAAVPEPDFEWVEEQFFELGAKMSEWADQALPAEPAPPPSLVQKLFGAREPDSSGDIAEFDPSESDP